MPITINDIAERLGISKSTVSKGLNNATDVSSETKRLILETAAEMGYINKRIRQNAKICIIIENIDYNTPNQFGYDIVEGFKHMAELEGWIVDIVPVTQDFQKLTPYDVFMIQEGYQNILTLFTAENTFEHVVVDQIGVSVLRYDVFIYIRHDHLD